MASTAERRSTALPPVIWRRRPPSGLERVRHTEFGRLLIAARREFLEAEGQFLSREELEQEIAERRGGVSWNDEARFAPTSIPAL